MNPGEFVSYMKAWFFNLFNCLKDFNNNSLEEVFVSLSDDKEEEIIVPESDNVAVSTVLETIDLVLNNVSQFDDVSETSDTDNFEEVNDKEEYGFEQELEYIDQSSDDDEYGHYYHT